MDKIRLKGFSVDHDSLIDRFGVILDDGEWYHFKREMERSWDSREYNLEKVIVDHIENSLFKLDYQPILKNERLKFVKK